MLDIPEAQATQFHFEYFRLTGQDELISLYARTKGKLSLLLKLFDELALKREMSIEHIANVVEISLHKLPYMEGLYDQAKREVDRLVEKRDYLLFNINSLKKELVQLKEEEKNKEECWHFLVTIIITTMIKAEENFQRQHPLIIIMIVGYYHSCYRNRHHLQN